MTHDAADEQNVLRARLRALADLTCAFAEGVASRDTLLALVARKAAEGTGDLCALWLCSDDGRWISLGGAHDGDGAAVARLRALCSRPMLLTEAPLFEAVVREREALFVPEVGDDDGLAASARAWLLELGARSVLVAPLRVQRRAVGALLVLRHRNDDGPLSEDEWDFAQTVADHAALALSHASLAGSVQDELTERRRAEAALASTEEQLRQMQKMEAVGRLAGGVAHGFNNILSVVLSYTDLLLADLAPDDPRAHDLAEIRSAGEQAAELTRQLLTFSRRQVTRPRSLDLNQALTRVAAMLRSVLGDDVDLVINTGANLWPVRIDPGQVEQVLMNLAANAHDAMPLGGTLTVETRNVDLGDDYVRAQVGVEPGSYVQLTVSDTGHGMDRETLDRIFEPFFTTKVKGRGAGLGLATVFGIVRHAGGHIRVFSEPGLGTTFRIYLPRTSSESSELPRPIVPAFEASRGALTVLLVEDDPQVREVVRGILERAGHRALVAEGPDEARALAAQHGGRIDLLLTDVVMPRMSGPQLAETLGAQHPTMRVLFMSGYTSDMVAQRGHVGSSAAFLEKPVTPESLLRKLAELYGE